MKRRNFLKILGSTGVIMAAGTTRYALTRTPDDALVPWTMAGAHYSDPVRNALSYAILAPNPHNLQPWQVDLIGPTEAILYCDLDRLLPQTDPFNRQSVIGLGCFLELFSIAAAEQGYRAEITPFPDGEPGDTLDRRPIARLSMHRADSIETDPLFSHILNRHTNRNPYDLARPVPGEVMQNLIFPPSNGLRIGTENGGDRLDFLRELTRDAMVTEFATHAAHMESVKWMRIGRAEIEANPDGISLSGVMLDLLGTLGILSRDSLADPSSSVFQTGRDAISAAAMASTGFIWIISDGNSRIDQINAGRSYMRIALQVEVDGLAIQPMSQALQEYPSMASHYTAIHQALTTHPTERVQMLARLGYAEPVAPSPRWPMETRLLNANG